MRSALVIVVSVAVSALAGPSARAQHMPHIPPPQHHVPSPGPGRVQPGFGLTDGMSGANTTVNRPQVTFGGGGNQGFNGGGMQPGFRPQGNGMNVANPMVAQPGPSFNGFGNGGANGGYGYPVNSFINQNPVAGGGYGGGNYVNQGGQFDQSQQGYYPPNQPGYYQQQQAAPYVANGGQAYQIPAGYAGSPAGSVINYGGASYVLGGDGTMSPYSGAVASTAAPAAVQRYQMPAGYTGYSAGSVFNYSGANYLVNNDGTMSPTSAPVTQTVAQPSANQRYQVPSGYESYTAGSVLSYGGTNYMVNSDRTMTVYNGAVQDAAVTQTTAATTAATSGPVPGQRYSLPAANRSANPGSILDYNGSKYLVNNDSTMTALSSDAEKAVDGGQRGPTPGKRYQVPSELVGTTPGSVVTYNEAKYVVNDDGTMTALSSD